MTEKTDLDALLMRVGLLERRNEELARRGRLLTGAVAACFLAGAAVLLVAAQPPRARSIEAERIVLRDANGRERAVLSVEADKDRVSLALRDATGKSRVRLVAAADEAGVYLADGQGRLRASVFEDRGKTGLATYDLGGSNRMLLCTRSDGSAMHFFDDKGKERVFVHAGPLSQGISFSDADRATACLSVRNVGAGVPGPQLELTGRDGKPVFVKP